MSNYTYGESRPALERVSETTRLAQEAYANYDQSVQMLDRRGFVGTVLSASALVLGVAVNPSEATAAPTTWQPSVYLGFEADGTVVIMAHRSEMGTSSRTTLPMMLADELEADWKKVRVEQALGDEKYGSQNTDGSCSVRDFGMAMHKAGATARTMFERAAAQKWGVQPGDVAADQGKVVNGKTKKSLTYAELLPIAAKMEVPKEHELRMKTPDQYKLIGKKVPMLDEHNIVMGKATFGMDAKVPGMLVAMVERPPVYGSKVKSFDNTAALAVKGVQKTVELPMFKQPHLFQQLGGVAVLGDSTWAVMQGRKKLKIDWEKSPNDSYNSADEKKFLLDSVLKPGKVVRNRGDVDAAFATSAKTHEANYYAPLLSHAPMEPPVAVAEFKNGKVETWCPTQNPQAVQEAVAAAMGIPKTDVICHVTLLGGGFGRKSKPDYVVEAALLSKATGKPVKVIWTREDDIKFDYYHTVSGMHMKAGMDANGKLNSWLFRSAFPPIASTFAPGMQYGAEFEVGMGLNELPYDIPNIRGENCPAPNHLRLGWMRAVAHVYHAFGIHSFLDELAVLNNTNYADYMLKSLGPNRNIDLSKDGVKPWNNGQPISKFPISTGRLRRVLEQVVEQSGYGKQKSGNGRGFGIAAHRSFLSYIASVVEVEVDKNGKVTIPNVWTVADCGTVVNPDRVVSQFEGAAVFGTSVAMLGEISAANGRIQQSNFNDYQVARLTESPRNIQVSIVPSKEPAAGVGEPGVPVIVPAITNAIFAATGKRVRDLPVRRTKLV
ncbi:MAG: xanthine dehydrogenase family protein molybdopterin-binding subunit [Acidobacteria bacterium]|nr:xanthine dehydrogenase family protein molybdopterin-binding subunit [Acidobacteriota bacterium]